MLVLLAECCNVCVMVSTSERAIKSHPTRENCLYKMHLATLYRWMSLNMVWVAISIFIIRNASLVIVARLPNSVAKCTKLLAGIPHSEIDLT